MNLQNFSQNLVRPSSEIFLGMNEGEPRVGDALVIVDLQNDFLSQGALAVPCGDEIIPVLNEYIAMFAEKRLPIFATRDCHPANHCSFREQGGPWPSHCVVGTRGAELASTLQLPLSAIVISKPSDPDRETYSPFEGTNFVAQLREWGIQRLFVGGLATEYCVLNTVKDALRHGFQVRLLQDAIRAVNVHPNDGVKAEKEMFRLGAIPFRRDEVIV